MSSVLADRADTLLAAMRDDTDSDWTQRLQARINVAREMPLTARELDVLRCASVGLSAQMTADVLGIRFHTARNHIASAILKSCAKNLTHAVALALRSGVIS